MPIITHLDHTTSKSKVIIECVYKLENLEFRWENNTNWKHKNDRQRIGDEICKWALSHLIENIKQAVDNFSFSNLKWISKDWLHISQHKKAVN
jgi:hypothetical protein